MTARPRCQTFPECNSARILRLPNLRAVNVGGQKIPCTVERYAYARSRTREEWCILLNTPLHLGARVLDTIDLECIILEFSSRYGILLEHLGSDGSSIMYSNTIKFQLYTADSALAVDHDVAEPALW